MNNPRCEIHNIKRSKKHLRSRKHLKNKKIDHRMINPNYVTDRNLQVEFEINLDSHHLNSKLTITTDLEFGIDIRDINQTIKRLSNIYARLINQFKFRCRVVFSERFDKQNEDEKELFITSQTDIDKIDVISQIQQKDSCWRFDKINSMVVYFYKTSEMNDSNYIKIPLMSILNTILNVESIDRYCYIWSILAYQSKDIDNQCGEKKSHINHFK